MSDEIRLETFPKTRVQAIALTWLAQQDLSNKTPAETAKLFDSAYKEIKKSEDARAQLLNY